MRYQPLADGKRLAVVGLGDAHLAQAPLELGRGLDMVGQRFQAFRQGWIARRNIAPLPAARRVAADRRVGILTERSSQRTLISGFGGQAGNR